MTRRKNSTPVDLTTVKSLREGTPIVIEWIDAHAIGEAWTAVSDVPRDPCPVRSIGYYLFADTRQIVYAQDYMPPTNVEHETYVNGVSGIPLGCVTQIHTIEEG